MLGIFYMLGAGITYAVGGVKASYENAQSKEYGIQKDNGKYFSDHTYRDRLGARRDIATGAYRTDRIDSRGDVWLADKYGNKLRNMSAEKRIIDAAKKAAKAPEGTKAIYFEQWNSSNSRIKNGDRDIVTGDVYKDIKTGELYFEKYFYFNRNGEEVGVERASFMVSYYMSIETGFLVCPMEAMSKPGHECRTPKFINDFMKNFNEKQKGGGYYKGVLHESCILEDYYLCCDRFNFHFRRW